jgi:hypothetical protein
MDMAKSDPKTAAEHKKHVSEISSKIEELMDKLSMVEKSKKPIETDDEKETLKENIESDIKSTLPGLDINVRQGKDSSVLTYGRGEPLSSKQIEKLETKYRVYEHEDESDDRGSSYYYTIKEKVSESINETLIGINPELVKKVKNFVNGIAKLYGYGTSDAIYNINAVLEFIKKQSINETQDKSYKVDDIVVVNKGPHKGIKHKIIYVSGDGKYNIKPILPPGSKNKYRLGAASASSDDFTEIEKDTEKVSEGSINEEMDYSPGEAIYDEVENAISKYITYRDYELGDDEQIIEDINSMVLKIVSDIIKRGYTKR